MNELSDLTEPAAIAPKLVATSRRQALHAMAELLANSGGIDARTVFEAVLMRERLGGTGIGEGVALPHAAVPGLKHAIGAFARLETPQDFDALDGRPADLVFMLLSPVDRGGDHLKALARVSRFFRRADMRAALRAARGVDGIFALFADPLRSDAA